MLDVHDPARGAALRRHREAALKTQQEVAGAARLGVVTVKRAEAGDPIKPASASALCAVYGIPGGAFVPPSWGHLPVPPAGAGATPASSVPPASPALASASPTSRRTVVVRWSFVAVSLALQAASFLPGWESTSRFILVQNLSLLVFSAVIVDVVVAHARRLRASGRPRAALAASLLAVAILSWQVVRPFSTCFADVRDTRSIVATYSRLNDVVRIRRTMDPAWDPVEATWTLSTWFYGRLGQRRPDYPTPGTYAARVADRSSCERSFLRDAVYDEARCGTRFESIDRRGPDLALRLSLGLSDLGDPVWPVDDLPVGGPSLLEASGFDEPRRILDAHPTDFARAMREARAWADARRDRAGPGG